MSNRSIEFFDEQFKRQVQAHEFALNPFEEAALPCEHQLEDRRASRR
ncbi:hypothetical protein [Anaeromyxobacter oryzae]|uniref:Uncharacterized protein n=1 Tax=Anaeromyxobacter oryzae TaxID=2918170 RepID=A0ABM7WXG4_9BACT|nr:hypothetical protein [Anaeromyxobacter oryzae]BDG04208.1 hypothetical protein AMOR_32040 [Anaeromyxobacter oryzae]